MYDTSSGWGVSGDQAGELSEGQEAVVPASSDGRGSGGVPCGPEVQGPADAAKAGQVRGGIMQCSRKSSTEVLQSYGPYVAVIDWECILVTISISIHVLHAGSPVL